MTAAYGNAWAQQGSRLRCFFEPSKVLGVIMAALIGTIGCSQGGSGNATTSVNPSVAASGAMELYDKDGSGSLDESELAASPGLRAARERYDTDGNGHISRDEIEARLTALYGGGTPWMTVHCQVLKGGRPLAGAKVRFDPEPFLENALQPAAGTTDSQGRVNPATAEEHHPESLKGRNIMRPGVYRVEVEHANVKQPHKSLGCEIDDLARGGTEPVFRL